jgi:exonuclease SbcC
MIESIELVNWKTHRRTTLKFQKGVNVLIGVMGAGKSSVMDALSFALFGTFPALTHRRTSSKELISSRPARESSAEVNLTFTIGADRYAITRKLSATEPTTSRIEKNGAYLQTQTERVNEEIASILKVDYDTFSRAIYAEQNRLDYFLELAKGERKKQIDQMLGLDSFAAAEENAVSLVNSMRVTIKSEEQALSQLDAAQSKRELERLAAERSSLEAETGALEESAKALAEESKRQETRLNEAKKREKQREALSRELEGLKSRAEVLEREIQKIGKRDEIREKTESLLKELKSGQERLSREARTLRSSESASLRALAGMETEIKMGGARLAELEKLRAELDKSPPARAEALLKACLQELDEATKSMSVSEGKREESLKAVAELEKQISKCPICEREMDEPLRQTLAVQKREALSKAERELASLKPVIAELNEKIKGLRERYDTASSNSKRLDEYPALKASLSALEANALEQKAIHAKAAAQVEENSASGERLAKEISAATAALEAINRREEYDREKQTLSKSMAQRGAELERLGDVSRETEELHRSFVAVSKSLADAESKIGSSRKYLNNIRLQIDEKTRALARIAIIEERLAKMRGQVASLNKFKAALVDTESALRNRLVHSINSLMHEIWLQIYPYGDYSGIRLNAGKDDYALEVATSSPDGRPEWSDINGMASGGERSIACLAMRIALSMVIVPNLRWLILDEPTHNIDENGIAKLVRVLGETLPSIVEQVFIITHDNALKNITGARIYQLDRDKAKNEHTSYAEL